MGGIKVESINVKFYTGISEMANATRSFVIISIRLQLVIAKT